MANRFSLKYLFLTVNIYYFGIMNKVLGKTTEIIIWKGIEKEL